MSAIVAILAALLCLALVVVVRQRRTLRKVRAQRDRAEAAADRAQARAARALDRSGRALARNEQYSSPYTPVWTEGAQE